MEKIRLALKRRNWYASYSLWTYLSLRKGLSSFEPDIIICHFLDNALPLQLSPSTIPKLVFVHGYDGSKLLKSSTNFRNRISKLCNQTSFNFLFVSKYLRNQSLNYIPNLNGNVFYLGTNTKGISPVYEHYGDVVEICQIARMTEKKGIDISIGAIALCLLENPDLNLKFHIIGDGPNLKKYKSLVSDSLLNHIEFHGSLSHNVAMNVLEKCHIYLHPSIIAEDGDSEGLCISVMEAIIRKKHVITTPYSGVTELIEGNEDHIHIVEPKINEISKKIKKVIDAGLVQPSNPFNNKKFDLNDRLLKLESLIIDSIITK